MEFTISAVLYFSSKLYEMQKNSDESFMKKKKRDQMKNSDSGLDARI